MTKKFKLKAYAVILFLFLVSIIIRLPHLDRPLSKHHEFNAAMILIPMEVWEQTPVADHYYSPIMNYQNEGDKGIKNITISQTEYKGNFFYLSFPSGTYLAPYVFFKLLGLEPSPFALQVFNMLTHLVCAILLFQIVLFITSSQLADSKRTIPALVAAAVFLFSPSPLWFYGNGYTHHTLVNVFLLWSILIALKVLYSDSSTNKSVQLFIALTLSILTAWSGYLLAFILGCMFLTRWYKQKQFQPKLLLLISSVLLGSFITYWQFSSVIGGDNFLNYLSDRFITRSGGNDGFGTGIMKLFEALGKWYAVGYLPILLFLLYQFFNLKFNRYSITKKERSFLILSSALIFSHHFLLREFTTVHNYAVLIDGILIIGVVGILLTKMMILGRWLNLTKIGLILVFVGSIAQYYYINRIGDVGQNGDRYDYMQKIGESIRDNSSPTDVIFMMNLKDKPSPQILYYAKRNFYYVEDKEAASKIMQELNIELGKLFVVEQKEVKQIISMGN